MMTSNVRCSISAPSFVNLKLYDCGYKVTVSLHISGGIADLLSDTISDFKVIKWRGKFYLHYEADYDYSTAFDCTYCEASVALRKMKIAIRQAKMQSLQNEIELLKCEF